MASPNPQSVDDLIVCLMSMGFELEDCQDAVKAGKLSVETALEWILQGKPGKPSAAPASLRLQQRPTGLIPSSNPFVNPIAFTEPPSLDAGTASHNTGSTNQEEVSMETDGKIISRLSMNEEQRKIKERFYDKQREEARVKAKEEKALEKKARADALKRIAEDREKKKVSQGSPSGSSTQMAVDGASPPKQTPPSTLGSSSTQGGANSKCTIQVRLPNGRAVKETFAPEDCFQVVWDFVSSKHRNIANMCLMQPFPRYEFSEDDNTKTLSDLGLTPTGSLVLKKVEQPSTSSPEPMVEVPPVPAPASEAMEEGASENEYSWGRGQRLETGEAAEDTAMVDAPVPDGRVGVGNPGNRDIDPEDMFDPAVNPNLNPILAGMPLPGDFGLGGGGVGGGGPGGRGHIWGEGVQLANQQGRDVDAHHSQPASQRAAEAARQRYAEPVPPVEPSALPVSTLLHDVSSLTHLCICRVTMRICDARNPIMSMGGVPEDVAQKILGHLLREKLLRHKTLQLFVTCHLRKLVLDCYSYATNELLSAIRYHTNLVHLSLRDCPLITDTGVQHISGLRRLKVLNLSSCRLLTNKCLSAVDLPNLTTLVLENTSVTDSGIQQYTATKPQHLLQLNLNRTAVTHTVFIALQNIPSLRVLLLEQTKLNSLTGIQNLPQLDTLNIAGTAIVADSLLCLSSLQSLTALNIANTENIIGDQALQYLAGLNLQTLVLPSRLHTTNEGMKHLAGLPLMSLDLTNYINVSDAGMEHIGKIHSLKTLILTNTKITDEGMLFLQGLENLEVLHLDRTQVSDIGAILLKAFKKLTELSLSSTGVSGKFLCEGALKGCSSLTKLNLSKTRVTDKGVRALRLPSLTMLNLDSTWVHQDVVKSINGCPCLTRVILHNLEPVREESDEDMENDN